MPAARGNAHAWRRSNVWGQDRNRFIRLELMPPRHRGDLVLPGSRELGELGRELTAAAGRICPAHARQ
jgi:hypothetical protein